jgi:hypothetical protein
LLGLQLHSCGFLLFGDVAGLKRKTTKAQKVPMHER